jgi:hypothetical protein
MVLEHFLAVRHEIAHFNWMGDRGDWMKKVTRTFAGRTLDGLSMMRYTPARVGSCPS